MQPGETLAGLLDRYADVAAVTDAAIASLPDLDVSRPLPPAGHADIIRESIDGAKSMG